MQYAITRSVLGCNGQIAVSKGEYECICAAKAGLLMAVQNEERFNMIRDNYIEYERELLGLAVESMVVLEDDWGTLVAQIYLVNRRLLNLLSSARLYRDHIKRDIRSRFGPGSLQLERIRGARERERRDSLDYEFIEAVRNSIQHHLLPVHNFSAPSEHDQRPGRKLHFKHRAVPLASLEHLAKDRESFPASLLAKLRPYADRKGMLPLNPFVRGYMQALARIHVAVREAIAEHLAQWDATMLEAVERGTTAFGDSSALVVGCYAADDEEVFSSEPWPKEEDLFVDLIERRKKLENRSRLAHLAPGATDYVSGE